MSHVLLRFIEHKTRRFDGIQKKIVGNYSKQRNSKWKKYRDAIQFKNILRIFEREWGLLSALLFIHFRHPGVIQRFCLLTLLKSAGPLNRWTEKKINTKY